MFQRHKKQLIWVTLGVFAIVLRQMTGTHPEWVEQYYSRGIFLGVRGLIDYGLAWLPFPLLYLFVPLILIWLSVRIRRFFKNRIPLKEKLIGGGLSVLAFVGGVVFFFMVLWGFNYGRVPVEKVMQLEAYPLDVAALEQELLTETRIITELRMAIPGSDTSALTEKHFPIDMEQQLRDAVEKQLALYQYPVFGQVRGRLLYPKGIFLRFSSAGLYFPLTGEGHADAGLHPLQLPNVLAHEMAHGYGFGDEGTCNFWAYLACADAQLPILAYCGHLAHWRTLAVHFRSYKPEEYKRLRESLPPGILADIRAINRNIMEYPDIMPRFREAAYEAYLKSQGISEGIQNYDRVVMLVKAWREHKGK
ncbi:MAG: DUF3810 domain-containing protein [Saprospiraceae bacterium]|nr:DUF3810 domain-containing protein [Saprospiraceae bacterium]